MILCFTALFALRAPSAPLDDHSWRQALSASVARNYYCGQDFAHPRVDCCGEGTGDGIVAMEFPLYAFAASVLMRAAGMRAAFFIVNWAAGVAFLFGVMLLARRMAERLGPVPTAFAGAAAASLFLFSPTIQQWSGAWLPDNAAWGLSVLGAGLLARSPILRWRDLAAPTALLALGVLSKTIAGPVLLLTVGLIASADRARPVRAALMALFHGTAVVTAWLAWYHLWNPHLSAAAACEIFALEVPRTSQLAALLTAVDVWQTLPERWTLLLGPARWLALLGLPLSLLLSPRVGLSGLLHLAGALGIFLLLGWHTKVHGYDALVFVLPAALGLGATAATLAWLVGRLGPTPTGAQLALGALLTVAAVWLAVHLRPRFTPHLARQAFPALAHELDLFLPEGAPFVATFSRADPRPSFFSARRVFSPENPGELCDPRASFRYDCADQAGFYSLPCGGPPRWGATVFFPRHTLMCGLKQADALPRLRAHLLGALPPSAVVDRPARGLGRVLGFDAGWEGGAPYVDLFVERSEVLEAPAKVGVEARTEPPGGVPARRVESWTRLDSVHIRYSGTPVINVLRLTGAFSEGAWRVRLLHPDDPEAFRGIEATVTFPPRGVVEDLPYGRCATPSR